jgi:hypothetical protein
LAESEKKVLQLELVLAAEIDLYLTTLGQAMQFIETSGMLKRQCMYCFTLHIFTFGQNVVSAKGSQ